MLSHIIAVVRIEHNNHTVALNTYNAVLRLRIRFVVGHDIHRDTSK